MNTTRILLAALLAGSGAGLLSAQTAPKYPGTRANFTLSVTATSEVGGFLVKASAVEANEAKGIIFSEIVDPLGYEPDASNPAHHYVTKETEKKKTFGSGDSADELTTEYVEEKVTKLVTQKFTNADFIEELIARDLVNIEDSQGYRLVVVQAAVRVEQDYEPPILFFIENGSSIHYVGRQDGDENDALVLDLYENVEAKNFKRRHVFKHRTEGGEVIEDEEGVQTVTETFSGRNLARISIFGSIYDEELDDFVGPEGVEFHAFGEVKYSGRYDGSAKTYVTTTASFTNAPGSFYDVKNRGELDEELDPEGLCSVSFSMSGKAIADITPYLNALPEALAELKAEIVASYSDGGE